jgi:hypothetical protein
VSALPPTLARSTLILHRCWPLPSEPGYAPHVYAASQPLQHRREWVTARRTGHVRERRKGVNSCGAHGDGGEAQDTQYGVSRSTNVSYHVCSSSVPPFERLRLEARGLSLNVALQLNGSLHYRITQLVIHQHQPESQELLRRRTRSRPNPAEGLASHSCEAGLSQGHPHIARYHTTTCQQLPTPQSTPRSSSTPFDGLGSHTSRGWMIQQPHAFRESQLPCAEVGGASGGRAHSVEVQIELLPGTPSSHSTRASLHAARTYEELSRHPCCRSRRSTEL